MLELKNITKIYNPGEITEACLFRDFNLSVEAGEFVSIVGSNGSGKTSLLNIICGSIPIEGGDVIIDGESMLHKKEFVRYRRFGRVYQNPALGTSPNLTMFENLSLADNKGKAYDLSRGANHARRESYREQLASLGLGLEDKMDIKMGALSGGQRQALTLCMSLAARASSMGSSALPCGFMAEPTMAASTRDSWSAAFCALTPLPAMSGSFVTSRTRRMVSSGEAEPVCAPVMIRASAPHSVAIRALSSMEMALLSMNVCFVWISHRRAMFSAPSSLR